MKKEMSISLGTLVAGFLLACSGTPAPGEERAAPGGAPPTDLAPPAEAPRPDAPRGESPAEAPPGTISGGPVQQPLPWLVAARTAAGAVALADIESGAVVAEAEGGALGGETDIACDPWLSRVLVFEADGDGEWGEIASHTIEEDAGGAPALTLGPRDHQVWIDGVARVAASPSGALVFEDGTAGPRWKLVSEGTPTPSAYGPRPAALESGFAPDGQFRVAALTYGPSSEDLDVRTAVVDPKGIRPESILPTGLVPPEQFPSVRWARTAAGPYLLSAKGGDLLLSVPAAGAHSPWTAVPVGPFLDRIEHAIALDDGHTLLAAASGDADVIAVSLAPDGSPACAAALDLPGETASSIHFFSRALVPAGPGRALAATSAGVFAIAVSGACPLAITVDPGFSGDALRGPLDLCPAAN